jgi:hypothetical protein
MIVSSPHSAVGLLSGGASAQRRHETPLSLEIHDKPHRPAATISRPIHATRPSGVRIESGPRICQVLPLSIEQSSPLLVAANAVPLRPSTECIQYPLPGWNLTQERPVSTEVNSVPLPSV